MSNPEQNDRDLARLLQLAGPRPEPAADVADEVYGAVRAHWQAQRRGRSRRRYVVGGALAASIAAIAAVLLWPAQVGQVEPGVIGVVDRIAGTLERNDNGRWAPVAVGDALLNEQTLRAGGSGAALQLVDGGSLRVAGATELRLDSPQRFALGSGRIYLDTAGADSGIQFEVLAGEASVRDIGTQFEVYTDGRLTRVRVRDGEVVLETAQESLRARRGEALATGTDGRIERSVFSSTDRQWQWATALAPPFETDNARVFDLVAWAARETGREVVFADARARNAAQVTRISGSITGLTPEQTLTTALSATRLAVEVENTAILISRLE